MLLLFDDEFDDIDDDLDDKFDTKLLLSILSNTKVFRFKTSKSFVIDLAISSVCGCLTVVIVTLGFTR